MATRSINLAAWESLALLRGATQLRRPIATQPGVLTDGWRWVIEFAATATKEGA